GGAGFPTHIKVANEVEIVIANGAECEPLLRVDQQLMAHFPEKLVQGMKILKEATNAKRAIIGLKDKYQKAYEALKPFADEAGVELFKLGAFYPAGDEVTLVYEVTGRIIPEGGLPLNVGCLVQNIHTLLWMVDAQEGKTIMESFVTVAGAVNKPGTFLVPVGISVEETIQAAGGPIDEDFVVINGGPMMGQFVETDTSITKKTSGLIVFPKDHSYVEKRSENVKISWKRAASACTVCEDCTKYCPRYLLGHRVLPHRAMRSSALQLGGEQPPMQGWALSGAICCECGICTLWSCPMDLRPREMMAVIKQKMMQTKTVNPFKGLDGPIHPAYEDRKIPVARLIKGLELQDWDVEAPIQLERIEPAIVRIPLSQHIGAPCTPVVAKGDKVKAGDLIGEIPEGALGARVHASVTGEVINISDHIEIKAAV
ncbi:MAG: SLBB domain-containing protein, partial [Candidatus Lindowbacteria bacterium]|nr:SLBB domain-containing protein [Candidatus Lindowbacteria bacterium]